MQEGTNVNNNDSMKVVKQLNLQEMLLRNSGNKSSKTKEKEDLRIDVKCNVASK